MKEMDGVEIGALVVLVAVVVLALLHWESIEHMVEYTRRDAAASSPAAVVAKPKPALVVAIAATHRMLQLPTDSGSLPTLAHSDKRFGRAVTSLIGRGAFERWWIPQDLIVHIVATVDNLGRAQVPEHAWPVQLPSGRLLVEARASEIVLAQANASRYEPYMTMVKLVNPQAVVAVYLHFYPLFQRAWRQLGYPVGQFNDRLVKVIGNLLAAPEPQAPLRLVQRHVLYQFVDPSLESASAGQKILMRIGLADERVVKAKLRALRAELLGHMEPERSARPRG